MPYGSRVATCSGAAKGASTSVGVWRVWAGRSVAATTRRGLERHVEPAMGRHGRAVGAGPSVVGFRIEGIMGVLGRGAQGRGLGWPRSRYLSGTRLQRGCQATLKMLPD